MQNTTVRLILFVFFAVLALPQGQKAWAQSDILPVISAAADTDSAVAPEETDPAVKLTPDKSEIIRLSRKAASIIVGNPTHLSVLPENATTLVLVPKIPGATYFTVLDIDKKVIMQRHVIVDGPSDKYMRIRKSCAGSKQKGCQETEVYYCPDMCHQIAIGAEGASSGGESGDKAAGASQDMSSVVDAANNADEQVSTEEDSSSE